MIHVLVFSIALAAVTALTPLSIRLAHRLGAVDLPDERKIHTRPVPRLGGLAVIFSVVLSLTLNYWWFGERLRPVNHLWGMVAGALILMVIGVWDDVRGVRPLVKFGFQLLAAAVAVSLGVQFELASNPLVSEMRDYFDLGILAFPLSMLWIVGLTNAMNLIDGLDGLASGIALFTSLELFLISAHAGAEDLAYVYIVLAGSTLGFLRYNRFPARVFLGDTGSMFLGFAFGCLSTTGFHKSFTLSSLIVPVIVFGVPILDSALALVRRYLNDEGLATADREHLHHRLLDIGLSQHQTVLLLYSVTVLLGIIGLAFTVQLDEYAFMIVVVIGGIGAILAKELHLFDNRVQGMDQE